VGWMAPELSGAIGTGRKSRPHLSALGGTWENPAGQGRGKNLGGRERFFAGLCDLRVAADDDKVFDKVQDKVFGGARLRLTSTRRGGGPGGISVVLSSCGLETLTIIEV